MQHCSIYIDEYPTSCFLRTQPDIQLLSSGFFVFCWQLLTKHVAYYANVPSNLYFLEVFVNNSQQYCKVCNTVMEFLESFRFLCPYSFLDLMRLSEVCTNKTKTTMSDCLSSDAPNVTDSQLILGSIAVDQFVARSVKCPYQ